MKDTQNKTSLGLGFVAGTILQKFAKSLKKPTTAETTESDFKTSTQKLGIRFTDRIRKIYRYRWLKKS